MSKTPKLRFKEFSGDWEEKKLGCITTKVGSGKTPKGGNSVYTDSGVIFIRSQNVLNGKLNLDDVAYINEEINSTMKSTEVYGSDILLNITGASIGRSCVVPKTFPKANVNQHVCIIRLNENYNANFIMNQIISSKIQRQIDSYQAGGNREGLNFEQIKSMKICSTSKEEQEKIASFFSLIDDKICLQSEKLEMLKDYKKGMMQKIFSRELRFKDDDGRDYPEWEEKKLGDIAECLDNRRKALNSTERGEIKGDIPYYGANGVVDYVNDYIFNEEIILLAEDGGNFDEFATRPIAQLVKGKSWVNNHAHVLKAKCNTEFLFYSLVHKDIRKYINGTSRAKLNKADMLDIVVELPSSLEEQENISSIFCKIDEKVKKEQEKLDSLNEYKKGLLQQMFV